MVAYFCSKTACCEKISADSTSKHNIRILNKKFKTIILNLIFGFHK